MNIVDSSGWLEYFADGENAGFFAPAIRNTENLLVPVITLYEFFKRVHGQSGLNAAEYSVFVNQGLSQKKVEQRCLLLDFLLEPPQREESLIK